VAFTLLASEIGISLKHTSQETVSGSIGLFCSVILNHEIGKIFTQGIYTGGFPASGNIQFEYSGMQFWSCMPVL